MDSISASPILSRLRETRPRLHGTDQTFSLGLRNEVLDFLYEAAPEGGRTLETGCGYSTIVLASRSASHITISPVQEEHARISEWCRSHRLSVDHVQFHPVPSQSVLPTLQTGPLDLVLIDGCHAFPSPFIDWYYTADALVERGMVVIDDTHIPPVKILCDFLKSENGRWALHREFKRTAVFQKLVSTVHQDSWWGAQPYCVKTHRHRRLEKWVQPVYEAIFRKRSRFYER